MSSTDTPELETVGEITAELSAVVLDDNVAAAAKVEADKAAKREEVTKKVTEAKALAAAAAKEEEEKVAAATVAAAAAATSTAKKEEEVKAAAVKKEEEEKATAAAAAKKVEDAAIAKKAEEEKAAATKKEEADKATAAAAVAAAAKKEEAAAIAKKAEDEKVAAAKKESDAAAAKKEEEKAAADAAAAVKPVPIAEKVEENPSVETFLAEETEVPTTGESEEGVSPAAGTEGEVPKGKEPGTWNQWLGSTGLKAAGVGMGLASAALDATKTGIAKVQKERVEGLKYSKAYSTFSREGSSVEIVVSAGSITSIPFFIPKGKGIVWKVMMKSLDISFGLKLRVQEDGGAVEIDMEPSKKVTAGEFYTGERKAVDYEDRRVVVILDNHHSKLRAKTLSYRVNIGDPESIAEIKELYARQEEEYNAQASEVEEPVVVTPDDTEADLEGGKGTYPDGTEEKKDESPVEGNKYVANLFALSSSVMTKGTSAAQFLQTTGGGVLGKFGWGKKAAPVEEKVEEAKPPSASYDNDSEADEGGEEGEEIFVNEAPRAFMQDIDLNGNPISSDSSPGVVVPPKGAM